jgi:hypothetical protein
MGEDSLRDEIASADIIETSRRGSITCPDKGWTSESCFDGTWEGEVRESDDEDRQSDDAAGESTVFLLISHAVGIRLGGRPVGRTFTGESGPPRETEEMC